MKKLLLLIFLASIGLKALGQGCVGTSGQVDWSIWMNFSSVPDSAVLGTFESYPDDPDQKIVLGSLDTPPNYTDNYVSLIRGFISVPVSGSYYFNLTGNERAKFFLSSSSSPSAKVEEASFSGSTGENEHKKYPSQTTRLLNLTAGQNYYFEIFHTEFGGSDFINLYWRRPNTPDVDTVWSIVDNTFLKAYSCGSSISSRGASCDDGDAATTNDQLDGYGNCMGEPFSVTSCIGTRSITEAYYFDNISGNYVENDLISAPKFPLLPDRKELLIDATGPLNKSSVENYGSLVQGYLTVPVSGAYRFNVTGDNQTIFYLSSNHDPANKQAHQAVVVNWVGEANHNASGLQTVGPVQLEKGRYYYYEIRHKENTGGDHFSLYWQTPFLSSWKRVSSFYLFDYACELSCVPQGTPCDDGNIFTNNDQYDANCNCVGTPCSGPNCNDELANYTFYEKAGFTNNNLTTAANSWESCGSSLPNPNPARSAYTRWIRYDFTDTYRFKDSRIWNYNVTAETDKGFRQVVVDVSLDGANWTPVGGVYTWNQAPGTLDYGGFIGPNFNDIKAKHILISSINNHGDPSCSGFSDIKINAQLCNSAGTACDDGDPFTKYDTFDNDCNCKGVQINCKEDSLYLVNRVLSDPLFTAKERIQSQSTIPSLQNIAFNAGNSIVLLPGFRVEDSAVFLAEIKTCLEGVYTALVEETGMQNTKEVVFRLNDPAMVQLELRSSKGETLATLLNDHLEVLGMYKKYIPIHKLTKGRYQIYLKVGAEVLIEEFEV